ncbi:hypothetical protein QE152_g20717 [Popillia japonica]|uniref:Uncharacterized protein n=1 Tax=Popillia japonica TaxID=7064 RepID=A0AAW1KNL3_POPJA
MRIKPFIKSGVRDALHRQAARGLCVRQPATPTTLLRPFHLANDARNHPGTEIRNTPFTGYEYVGSPNDSPSVFFELTEKTWKDLELGKPPRLTEKTWKDLELGKPPRRKSMDPWMNGI